MLRWVILSIVLLVSPVFVCSLKCYNSKESFVLDYLMTSETVPSFSSKCELIDGLTCYVSIEWNLITNKTRLDIRGFSSLPSATATNDVLTVSISMQKSSAETSLSLTHKSNYFCDSIDTCNDENNVRKLLRSLVIKEQFRQELSSLLQTVSPFDAKAAQCLDFSNSSSACPTSDLSSCQRCEILLNKPSTAVDHLCARCPKQSEPENMIARLKIFHLNDPNANSDDAVLACQVKACNSVININRIYQTSQITFNSIFLRKEIFI